MADQFDADASLLRSTGARRNHDPLRMQGFDFADANLVVTAHLDFRPQFSKILNEVVSKRVVIVEDEDHKSILAALKAISPPDAEVANIKFELRKFSASRR
jgi:hypothetical protein